MADGLRFFRTWLQKPVLTGAISPSGKALARAMARPVDADSRWPVLELGPGTGPVTAALIAQGVAAERIVALEYNPEFCALLVKRFRGLNVVEGDAYDLATSLPPGARQALISQALGRVLPGGGMIQFSYGFGPPVPAVAGRFTVIRIALVLANLPPARVWLYRSA